MIKSYQNANKSITLDYDTVLSWQEIVGDNTYYYYDASYTGRVESEIPIKLDAKYLLCHIYGVMKSGDIQKLWISLQSFDDSSNFKTYTGFKIHEKIRWRPYGKPIQ